MVDLADYPQLSAVQLSEAVRTGRVTATAVTKAALGHIDRRDRDLNAFSVVLADEALRAAATLDDGGPGHGGPLAGVPIAVKAEIAVAGQVTTYGGRAFSQVAPTDSEIVRRLRAAGAVIVGTTNMPEFGQFPFTEGASWGLTRNPWDPTRSTGGSSGGSAAAVASGCVPVAIGGDGGGSIRIPASCCGLVGLKPMRGRVSAAPAQALWGALGTAGPLTRTVADTAVVYDALRGTTSTDRWSAPAPVESFVNATLKSPERLKIGWLTVPALGPVRVDPKVRRAVQSVATSLAEVGHQVAELDGRWPDVQSAFVPQFFGAIRECAMSADHPSRLEWRTRSTARMGAWAGPRVVRRAEKLGETLRTRFSRRFNEFDVLLTPTMACVPPTVGALDGVGSVHALLKSLPMIAFTTLANVTGLAALSLPAGLSSQGLPIGVQLSAVGGDETMLISLAAELEQLRPWPGLPAWHTR